MLYTLIKDRWHGEKGPRMSFISHSWQSSSSILLGYDLIKHMFYKAVCRIDKL
jgi:hypothetical protein